MNTRIYNARILTMEEGRGIFEGELWIEGDTITYAGRGRTAAEKSGTSRSTRRET